MSNKPILIKNSTVWFSLLAALAALYLFALLYTYDSKLGHLPASLNVAHWGAFGDFIGGSFNPVAGLITIVLLVITLSQNARALQLTRDELIETRKQIELGVRTQEKNETLLQQQLSYTSQEKDLNTCLAILNHLGHKTSYREKQVAELRRSNGALADRDFAWSETDRARLENLLMEAQRFQMEASQIEEILYAYGDAAKLRLWETWADSEGIDTQRN